MNWLLKGVLFLIFCIVSYSIILCVKYNIILNHVKYYSLFHVILDVSIPIVMSIIISLSWVDEIQSHHNLDVRPIVKCISSDLKGVVDYFFDKI